MDNLDSNSKQIVPIGNLVYLPRQQRSTAPNGGDQFSVRFLITALYRRKWLVLSLIFLITGASVAVALMLPNKYSSRMKFLVRNARSDMRVTAEDTRGSAVVPDVSEADINTEVALLTSRDLLQQVVEQTNFIELEKPAANDVLAIFTSADQPAVEPSRTVKIDGAIGSLEKRLTVAPVKKSNIIEVGYVANSPERAAAVLQKLSALYLDMHLRLHNPAGSFDLFKDQSDQYAAKLKADENNLAGFESANNLVAINEQKQSSLKSLADAEAALYEAEAALGENDKRTAALNAQLEKVPTRVITQTRTLPNQDSAERLNTLLVELRNKRTQLLTKFRGDDRLVKEVDEQIRATGQAYNQAVARSSSEQATDLNPLRQKLETELATAMTSANALRVRRATHQTQVQQYRTQLKGLEGATRQHETLQRTLRESEENYKLYAGKREEARITEAFDREKISNIEIAETATMSLQPSSPNRKQTVALGLFLALFVGVGAALALEFMRETVSTPQELERLMGYPVFTVLPKERRLPAQLTAGNAHNDFS